MNHPHHHRFAVPEPRRANLRGAKGISPRAAEPPLSPTREEEPAARVDRSQHQLHRFFEELLRRSEH